MPQLQVPQWVDRSEYPFESRRFSTDAGALHYIDEGVGPAFVMLHGNPSWSFEYRHLIKALSPHYRCIAIDHLGFGLSDKPGNVRYTGELHGRNVTTLLEHLGLQELVLMIGDWGGPTGLSFAVKHPGRVKGVVMANTWAWPIEASDFYYQGFSRFMGGPIGRYLIRNHNFFVERVMVAATGKKSVLTPRVMAQYRGPFAVREDRQASWCFPGQIVGAYDWLQGIWSQRETFRHLPFLVLWGEKDIAFRLKELERWKKELTHADVHVLRGVGHYVAEEAPDEVLPLIRQFLKENLGSQASA
jgi:haloalkane dehalogenase